jgi:threonine dehydrogenase-like Zn-dependent dehydrogenase
MRAAVMRDGRLVVDDVPEPVPAAGEVLVSTLACGICGSDLHALKHTEQFVASAGEGLGGGFDPRRDVVMGHEFCAEVLDYATGTERALPIGTRVCSVPMLFRNRRALTIGYSNDAPGGFAERMVLASPLLVPVPNGLATEHAALTEPMAVGCHAVAKANPTRDDVPLVIGCGPIGLAVIAALRARDVRPIIAADFSPLRRRLAEQLGADTVLDPGKTSPYTGWRELASVTRDGQRVAENPLTGTPLLRPGLFFECVGLPGIVDQMMVGAESGCRFVIAGVCMEPDQIRPLLAVTKELNLQFVLGYTQQEFSDTLRRIADGKLDTQPLVTGRVGIDGVADAFEELAQPERHAKVLVEPWR